MPGQAIVRVRITQFPAEVGAKDVLEINSKLVDRRAFSGKFAASRGRFSTA
jgi:hypothetical protein